MPSFSISRTTVSTLRDGAPRPSLLTLLRRAAMAIALWPARVARARREYARLSAMTEYELRDIGLSRVDLADVSALALDEDPTLVLARKVEERRAARGSRRA